MKNLNASMKSLPTHFIKASSPGLERLSQAILDPPGHLVIFQDGIK